MNGCHNRADYKPSYLAQDGYYDSEPGMPPARNLMQAPELIAGPYCNKGRVAPCRQTAKAARMGQARQRLDAGGQGQAITQKKSHPQPKPEVGECYHGCGMVDNSIVLLHSIGE